MRFPLLGRWEDADTGEVIVERLCVAESFFQKFAGLQFARPLPSDTGLLLRKCRSIHTMWMRFAIDVVFLGEDMKVLHLKSGVLPWRIALPRVEEVAHVIELTSGVRNIFVGQRTRIVEERK